jgi:hypothetical protein
MPQKRNDHRQKDASAPAQTATGPPHSEPRLLRRRSCAHPGRRTASIKNAPQCMPWQSQCSPQPSGNVSDSLEKHLRMPASAPVGATAAHSILANLGPLPGRPPIRSGPSQVAARYIPVHGRSAAVAEPTPEQDQNPDDRGTTTPPHRAVGELPPVQAQTRPPQLNLAKNRKQVLGGRE